MNVSIYCLKDPRTDLICYIGKAKDPEKRQKGHRYSHTNRLFAAWVRELSMLGLEPVMQILEVTTSDQADTREWHWIEWAVNSGLRLVNKQGMSRFRND